MSSFRNLIKTYHAKYNPYVLPDLEQLLKDLAKIVPLADLDIECRDKLIGKIKSFGSINKRPCTKNQWAQLSKTMYEFLEKTQGPSKFCRINTAELSPEVVALFMNLMENLSSESLISSKITTHVLDFFTLANILQEDGHFVVDVIQYVTKILVLHGWTDSGFNSPPNQKDILADLQKLLNTGIELPL